MPFFQNSLAGDVGLGCWLFGALAVAQTRFPNLAPTRVPLATQHTHR